MLFRSLAALRDYSRAVELGDLRGEFDKAVPLLQQALKEDSTFAQAWRKLAAYRVSAGGTLSEAFAAAAAAYRYRERLPDDERYEVEAYYTRELSTKGGADYYAAHTDFLSQNNRVISLYNLGQLAAAESVVKAQIAADLSKGRKPIVQLRTNLIWTLVGQDKLEEARKTLEETKRDFPGSQAVELGDTWITAALGPDSLAAASTRYLRSKSARVRAQTARGLSAVALAQGRLKRSSELERIALAVEDSTKFNFDPVGNSSDVAVSNSVSRGAPASGVRVLDSLAGKMAKGASWIDRSDLRLAAAYAQLGRVDKAKALVGEFDRTAKREERLIRWGDAQLARAEIALAEGRSADAITAFRQATFSDSGNVEPYWSGRTAFGLARAHDKANQADSAIAWFEKVRAPNLISATAVSAPVAVPAAARRLGELYEQKGDLAKAIASYEEFVKYWKDADAELQPQVADVKARIARLRAKEAAKR